MAGIKNGPFGRGLRGGLLHGVKGRNDSLKGRIGGEKGDLVSVHFRQVANPTWQKKKIVNSERVGCKITFLTLENEAGRNFLGGEGRSARLLWEVRRNRGKLRLGEWRGISRKTIS